MRSEKLDVHATIWGGGMGGEESFSVFFSRFILFLCE